MSNIYSSLNDDLCNDEQVDPDVEYPRDPDDGHPGPFASVAQIVAYYEAKLSMYPEKEQGDA